MYLFAVYVTDRVDKTTACVGDMLTRAEAGEIKRCLEKYNACDVQIVTSVIHYRKGGEHREEAFF